VNSYGDCYVPATGGTHSDSGDEFYFKGHYTTPLRSLKANREGATPKRRVYEKL